MAYAAAALRRCKMRILVGHERFGILRTALRKLGHDAWSCDLVADALCSPYHHTGDIRCVLSLVWDAAIFFPDCTYLTTSAAWAYSDGPYHQNVKPGTLVGKARRLARSKAIAHVKRLIACGIEQVAIENPARSFLCAAIGGPDQIIQPNMFGHDASKATGLWKRNLPDLIPTKQIAPRMVNGLPRWANQTDSGQNRLGPSEDRAMDRARTYEGIANAMALQWFGVA